MGTMKNFTFISVLILSTHVFAGEENTPADPARAKISGTPRLIRESPVPQVFFQEFTGSLLISTTGEYNRIMNALIQGQKKKKPVSFFVNKKTGTIIDVDAPVEVHNTSLYEDAPEAPKTEMKEEKKDGSKDESKNDSKK
jgi:hypothetical protein